MESAKEIVRQEVRAQRAALAEHLVREAGVSVVARVRALPAYRKAVSVLAYVAKDNEVPTGALIADGLGRGQRIYLPRAAAGHFIRYVPGHPLVPGCRGVLEPTGDETFLPGCGPAVALIPLLAWDQECHRLGRGGGWYDRVLAGLGPTVVKVGIGYEFQRRDRLPHTSADVVLDFVVTERRLVTSRRSPCAGHVSEGRGT